MDFLIADIQRVRVLPAPPARLAASTRFAMSTPRQMTVSGSFSTARRISAVDSFDSAERLQAEAGVRPMGFGGHGRTRHG